MKTYNVHICDQWIQVEATDHADADFQVRDEIEIDIIEEAEDEA